jgi:hypothetical protein
MRGPFRGSASLGAYMWDKMKDWLLHGAIGVPFELQ